MIATENVDQTSSVDLVLHETGHAYDALNGINNLASNPALFKSAYSEAGSEIQDYFGKYGEDVVKYYSQVTNEQGFLSEMYAESFANFFSQIQNFALKFPSLNQYWLNQTGGVAGP